MKKINIGIVSCASIAIRSVIPALLEMAKFNIVGIASRSKEKADSISKKINKKAFYDYESLILFDSIEAVYIALPNSLHYEWIKKSLKKGLHVLVEKSMSCDFKEVKELNNLAREKNLVLIENFQFRFHSQMNFIKNLVANGEIGELRNMRASFGFPPFPDDDNIRYKRNLGGGALLDAGAYPIRISQIFLGNDIYVQSANLETLEDKEVDIWGSACLKQNSGKLVSQIAFGFDHYYQNSIELWGNKGKIFTNRIFTASPEFEPIIEIETNESNKKIKVSSDNHFKNMLNYFYTQVITKQSIEKEYYQNINQARLIKQLKEKADEQ